MPQLQVVDLNRPPEEHQPTSLEKTLSGFAGRHRQNQLENQEADALKDIYGQYQKDGGNIDQAITAATTRAGLSPTSRVNTVKQLMEMKKYNGELQKKAQEDVRKAASNQSKVADLEQRRGLSTGSLAAYADDPKMAEQISRPIAEQKKTQASQPIDPDQLRRIQHVENMPGFEQADIPGKQKLLRDAGVSKENANSVINPFIEEEKVKPGGEFRKLREKAISDYVNNALTARDAGEEMKFIIDSAKKAVQGEVAGPGIEAIIKNDPYGQLFLGLTPHESELQASNKKLLEGNKGIFGSKPTEKEIFLLLNSMLPSIGKSKEANLASLYFIEKLNNLKIIHGDLVDEITVGGSKYVPDLESQVNQRMKPMIDEFRKELSKGVEAQKELNQDKKPATPNRIKVRAPNGIEGYMTPEQIKAAKEKNVVFTPI